MEPYDPARKDKISHWMDHDYERHIKRLKTERELNIHTNQLERPRRRFT